MKLFTAANAGPVVAIAVVVFIISSFGLDLIPHGTGTGHIQDCQPLLTSVNGAECHTGTYDTVKTGWPFVAHVHYKSGTGNDYLVTGSSLSLNGILLFVLCLAAYIYYKRNQDHINLPFTTPTVVADGPIISSSDLLNEGDVMTVATNQVAGYNYRLLTNTDGRVMVLVDLHGNTNLHIVALGDKSKLSVPLVQKVEGDYLKPVELEGDFPDYFHLYCSPARQVELRQVLDPSAMALLVDFCQTYDIEIFESSLYLSQAEKLAIATNSDVVADTGKLLAKCGPAFESLAHTSAPN